MLPAHTLLPPLEDKRDIDENNYCSHICHACSRPYSMLYMMQRHYYALRKPLVLKALNIHGQTTGLAFMVKQLDWPAQNKH